MSEKNTVFSSNNIWFHLEDIFLHISNRERLKERERGNTHVQTITDATYNPLHGARYINDCQGYMWTFSIVIMFSGATLVST